MEHWESRPYRGFYCTYLSIPDRSRELSQVQKVAANCLHHTLPDSTSKPIFSNCLQKQYNTTPSTNYTLTQTQDFVSFSDGSCHLLWASSFANHTLLVALWTLRL